MSRQVSVKVARKIVSAMQKESQSLASTGYIQVSVNPHSPLKVTEILERQNKSIKEKSLRMVSIISAMFGLRQKISDANNVPVNVGEKLISVNSLMNHIEKLTLIQKNLEHGYSCFSDHFDENYDPTVDQARIESIRENNATNIIGDVQIHSWVLKDEHEVYKNTLRDLKRQISASSDILARLNLQLTVELTDDEENIALELGAL